MRLKGLGRRVPPSFAHVERYPYSVTTVAAVERVLQLPFWHWSHDQGLEGACVGFGSSMMMGIRNLIERRDSVPQKKPFAQRYDSWWLWDRAKEIDWWPDTNPGDSNGTSVSAAMDILRARGHVKVANTNNGRAANPVPSLANGISANRWARSVDEMRSAVASAVPVTIGVNWYSSFDFPALVNAESWIGRGSWRGSIRGGHAVCVYGASDRRQAFRVKNSWGRFYPLVWIPYSTMQVLLDEYGEATLVTDR
jgi:hypothetical protein